MRLTLRDLFWLVVIAAIGVCWSMEHVEAWKRLSPLRAASPYAIRSGPRQPSGTSVDRLKILEELASLKNGQVLERFNKLVGQGNFGGSSEYTCCLTDMARRQMSAELQELYDERPAEMESNLLLLTALRRSQGKPDPLRITAAMSPPLDEEGKPVDYPRLVATMQNADADKAEIILFEGGDYRSGRRERWRVHFTDQKGRRVEDSNFANFIGGGVGSYHTLKAGETARNHVPLDCRSYVRQPASGVYTVELVHCDHDIADEPDLEGLIVWKSQPLQVTVQNSGMSNGSISVIPLLSILGIAGVGLAVLQLRRARQPVPDSATPRKIAWRDVLCAGVVIALIAGWLGDSYYLRSEIIRLQPDREATWTIQPVR